MDIGKLFNGIAIIVDNEIEDKTSAIYKIKELIEAKNIPVAVFSEVPQLDVIPAFASASFAILDWDYTNNGRLEVEEGERIAIPEALAANGQLYKAIPIDHNKPSINELTEYFKFKFNPAKRTLIFVQNQWALPRVYKALQPMAHLLPQQIGLLGLNCEDWTNLTTPTVSTIIEPVDQEGREAAEMLLALLDGSSEPGEQRILECKLNWLDSTSI